MVDEIRLRLACLKDDAHALILQRFFKTAPGEYGEGDLFLGIRVPLLRRLAREFDGLALTDTCLLLNSSIHEERLLSLLILVHGYRKGDVQTRKRIYGLYLKNIRFINNWDLVDSSAEHIVGAHLMRRSREPLHGLACSSSLWKRRIAIMATFHFIKNGDFKETLSLVKILMEDREDLIHKACGWMLREIGKRDMEVEQAFLNMHCPRMPRTMLRYSIEKFPQELRRAYLNARIENAG
jgi:3-methyladenine DNA glycosylase AlkD